MSTGRATRVDTRAPWVRLVTLSVTLLLLFLVTQVTLRASADAIPGSELTVLVGFVLLVASVAGRIAVTLGLPQLTGFLLVGILAGPSVVGVISTAAVGDLRLIDRFALALIAMLAGGELKVATLRPQARHIILTTLAITGVVWVGMTGAVLAVRPLVAPLAALPLQAAFAVALLLGVWAANSSPDLTVAVVEETSSAGALTDVILGVTIVKDALVIVLFTLTLALVGPLVDASREFSSHVFVDLAREVGGAIVVGSVLGWVFSLYLGDDEAAPRSPAATFLFAYLLVVLADRLHVELLLTGVAAGFVIENLSPAGDRMIQGIVSVSVVFFAFFFTIAGAGLDLGAVGRFWLAALLLLAARALFTWLGTFWGMRLSGADETLRRFTWQGMISQGGVTLGLILLVGEELPELQGWLVALAMAVILGNVLGGPILLKRALTAADQGSG